MRGPKNGLPKSNGSFLSACLTADVGAASDTCLMADIEIIELRAFEPHCLECGETGPIETSVFFAMAWEEAHVCVAARIDADAAESVDAGELAIAS